MQELLPIFELSEQDLIERALLEPFEVKVERSIATLRTYESIALKHNQLGYNLRFSG